MAKIPPKASIPPGMPPSRAIELIRQQIERLDREIMELNYNDPKIKGWLSTTETILNAAFGQPDGEPERRTRDFLYVHAGIPLHRGMSAAELQHEHRMKQQRRKALLESYVEQLEILEQGTSREAVARAETFVAGAAVGAATVSVSEADTLGALDLVEHLCHRFHTAARQLELRHDDRATLKIADEYDVQDLLHAFLRLHFDDVRPEEWTPSYAGTSSRMDFLLKDENIVIEVKMARLGRGEKKIGEELIIDATHYKEHPRCKRVACLIYDPERVITNPRGFENDIEGLSDARLTVLAVVVPQ
jgi:hypothetical protein